MSSAFSKDQVPRKGVTDMAEEEGCTGWEIRHDIINHAKFIHSKALLGGSSFHGDPSASQWAAAQSVLGETPAEEDTDSYFLRSRFFKIMNLYFDTETHSTELETPGPEPTEHRPGKTPPRNNRGDRGPAEGNRNRSLSFQRLLSESRVFFIHSSVFWRRTLHFFWLAKQQPLRITTVFFSFISKNRMNRANNLQRQAR